MKKFVFIFAHGVVGWLLCGATIGIGFTLTSEDTALIIHAIAAPIIFGVVSWNYFRRFHYTSPKATAFLFLSVTIFLDFFLAGLLIQGNLVMFTSFLGTWLPFGLIFLSTYVVGRFTPNHAG